jgi:hypothetical protein
LVLMINTFANTLPNRTTFGEVSNFFHIHELFFEFGGKKIVFLCNCYNDDDHIVI